MFNQTTSFYHQSMYLPSFMSNFAFQFANYYGQIPFTYQTDVVHPTCQCGKFQPIAPLETQPSIDNQKDGKLDCTQLSEEKSLDTKDFKRNSIFKYPKKNAESNVINQIFSFLSLRPKSEHLLEKILKHNAEKIENFYQLLKQLKKKNKKYINRCYVKDLALFNEQHFGYRIYKEICSQGSKNALTLEEFQKAVRTMVSYYLRSKCISTVITSRKLDKETMKEHLHRKREVQDYFATQMQIIRDGKY